MLLVLFVFSFIHAGFFLWLTKKWSDIPEEEVTPANRGVSVIIPVRNEAHRIYWTFYF